MDTYTLNDICELITDGSHFSPEDEGAGYPMLSVKDMGTDDFSFSSCKRVGEESFQKLVSNGCKPLVNDVVVAKDGSYLKTAFPITEDRDIALLSSIAILRPNTALVNPSYLSFFLKSKEVYRTVSLNYISGTALKRIILKGIKKIPIDLPSLQSQQHRVDVLEALNRIIQKRNQELQILDNLIKARFVEMFGDKDKYPREPLNHNVHEMFIGPFGSALKNECFVEQENGYCIVYEQKHAIKKTMDVPTRYVDENKYLELKRFSVFPGDIIVSCRGTIGEIFVVPEGAPLGIMHPSIMKIRLDTERYDQKFFVLALERYMEEHNNEAKGSGVKMAVTATTLGQELFVVPPMDVQKNFSTFVEQVDKSKVVIQKSLDETQLLFDSLMQEYFE